AVHADNRRRPQFRDRFHSEIDRAVVVPEIALTLALRPISCRALGLHQMQLILERGDTAIARQPGDFQSMFILQNFRRQNEIDHRALFAHIFEQIEDFGVKRDLLRGLFSFVRLSHVSARLHEPPSRDAVGGSAAGFRVELIANPTVAAEMAFRIDHTWNQYSTFEVDDLARIGRVVALSDSDDFFTVHRDEALDYLTLGDNFAIVKNHIDLVHPSLLASGYFS